MTATFVRTIREEPTRKQALYRLEPPLDGHAFVVVSAVSDAYVNETYIFGANADGVITEWLELDGSFQGGTDILKALKNAGYEARS